MATGKVFAQGEIPVNMYTGTPEISVTLYTLTDHDLSEPLTMSYNVNDVRRGAQSYYGLGWSLTVGGQVSRQVRGLPDDFAGSGSDTRKGWLYNNNYSSILSFGGNASDANPAAGGCDSYEIADHEFINSLGYKIDTEPDLFSFSVGGYSGKFVFGNDGLIKLIPYQDLAIVPTYVNYPTDKTILGWTITTSTGIKYSFNTCSQTKRSISKANSSNYKASDNEQTDMTLFDSDYNMYKAALTYTSSWMLSKTQSPTGAWLSYSYSVPANGSNQSTNNWMTRLYNSYYPELYDPNSPSGSYWQKLYYFLMSDQMLDTVKLVSKITTSSGMWATCDPVAGIKLYDSARTVNNFKSFILTYNQGNLTSITESDGEVCPQNGVYQFYYNPWTGGGGVDFWGYNNGASNWILSQGGYAPAQPTYFPTIYVYPDLPPAERYRLYKLPHVTGREYIIKGDANLTPDGGYITAGTLKRMVYPSGGETDFTFEANDYYDVVANQTLTGGGIRVKSITYFDGINPAANMVKNFSYVDSLGRSSGRLINRPVFAVPLWKYIIPKVSGGLSYQHDYDALVSSKPDSVVWKYFTAVTASDVSEQTTTQGSLVGYTRVTVARPGSGHVTFDYHVPATYGSNATGNNPTDYSPTVMKFARPAACPAMGVINQSGPYGYASFHNMEYDYERGLVKKKSEYNEGGVLVRLTQTTYQYLYKLGSAQPTTVTGLVYDKYPNSDTTNKIFIYGKYKLLTDVAKVISTETVTTYDENLTSKKSTFSNQYIYSSPNHRFLSQLKRTAPDSTVYTTSYYYVPDYPASISSTDPSVKMLATLRLTNRNQLVIEQVNSEQPVNGTSVTTGASLVKFDPFTSGRPLLLNKLVFRADAPITNFMAASIDVTGNHFIYDSHYDTVLTYNEYDRYDIPVSTTGENKTASGTLFGYSSRLPVAQFSNALSANIGLSDFETTTVSSFGISSGYYGTGRTGVNGIYPCAVLNRTLVKPANANNYILSFWAKPQSGASSITLTVTLKNTGGATLSATNHTFTYAPGVTDYQYFTQVIDVASMPSVFMVQLQGQSFTCPGNSSPSLLPLLDDISFYPEFSLISTSTYDVPFGANSATSPSGSTTYTTYDTYGRARYVSDQDHNIRQRLSYNYPAELRDLVASVSSGTSYISTTVPAVFYADSTSNQCFSGITYEWSFDGSGFTTPSVYAKSPHHLFSTYGVHSVEMRVKQTVNQIVKVTKLSSLSFTIQQTSPPPLSVDVEPGVFSNGMVTITATPENAGTAAVSYQWYMRTTGTTEWSNMGGTTNTFTRKINPGMSYDFMCTVSVASPPQTASGFTTVSFQ